MTRYRPTTVSSELTGRQPRTSPARAPGTVTRAARPRIATTAVTRMRRWVRQDDSAPERHRARQRDREQRDGERHGERPAAAGVEDAAPRPRHPAAAVLRAQVR